MAENTEPEESPSAPPSETQAAPPKPDPVDDGAAFTPARLAIIVLLLALMVYQVRLIMTNLKSQNSQLPQAQGMPSQPGGPMPGQPGGPGPGQPGGPGPGQPGGPMPGQPGGPGSQPGNGGQPGNPGAAAPNGQNPGATAPGGQNPGATANGGQNPGGNANGGQNPRGNAPGGQNPGLAPGAPNTAGQGNPAGGPSVESMPQFNFYGALATLSQDKATALTAEQSKKIADIVKSTNHPKVAGAEGLGTYCSSLLTGPQLDYVAKNRNVSAPDAGAPDPLKGDPTLLAAIKTLSAIAGQDAESVPLLDSLPSGGAPSGALTPEDMAHGLIAADKMPSDIAVSKEQAVKLVAALKTLNAVRTSDRNEKQEILALLNDAQKAFIVKIGSTPPGQGDGVRPISPQELLSHLSK